MGAILAIVGVIAMALLGASNPSGNNLSDFSKTEACKPRINKNRLLKVDVSPDLDSVYVSNPNSPGGNKEEKKWVLVKENAPIPAWKVELELHGSYAPRTIANPRLGEMERLGISQPIANEQTNPDAQGKTVYIGIGWCNPENGETYQFTDKPGCLDPLVQDTVFVLTHQGMTIDDLGSEPAIDCAGTNKIWLFCHEWGENPEQFNNPPHTQENLSKYWWKFNVYYDASKLPAEPTYEDLPCWMKLQCPNGGDVWGEKRYNESLKTTCEVENVLGATDDQRPRLIINKNEIIITNPPSGITLADYYISMGKLSDPPDNDPIIGTGYASHFNIRIRKGTITGTSADHILILDPRLSNHDGPYWTFYPITGTSKPIANTLQLGTFTPGIPSFFYEWWTPSCKPAIYLYPEKETEISVKVEPNGYITQSIPKHGEKGWQVIAKPDGTINVGSATYPYLYYEAAVKNVAVPKDTGWIVETTNLPIFFNYMLPRLGLNEKESTDFLEYWIPKLNAEGHNWYITLIEREELDRVEPIEISPKPDTFIRLRFYFEKIDENEIAKLRNYEIRQFDNLSREAGSGFARDLFRVSDFGFRISKPRRGFVVVDWGGIIANGSCGEEEVSR